MVTLLANLDLDFHASVGPLSICNGIEVLLWYKEYRHGT